MKPTLWICSKLKWQEMGLDCALCKLRQLKYV